jgi:hypothetical protein
LPEISDAAFGVSTDAIEAFYLRELNDEQQWPYFRIPLRSGFSVEVEYANVPEDHEIIYRVCHDEWTNAICAGKGGGNWQLPAFCWAELVRVSSAVGRKDAYLGVYALLLLFPGMWLTKADDLEEVRRHLLSAWKRLGFMPEDQAAALVERLVDCSQGDVQWSRHEQFGWISNGNNSRRNPNSPVCLSGQEFRDLLAFSKAIDN